jgi:RHS repeat-associated protein
VKGHIFKVVATAMLWMLCYAAHAGTHHYYYTDPQGTVLAKADASGTIIATYDYAPYGTAVASMSPAPNGPGYTGHVNDPDTGLVYMQARYYDPAVGRFLSVDPVMPTAGSGFNFNRYDYGNNNPIGNTDPTGKDDCGYLCMEHRAQSDGFIFGGAIGFGGSSGGESSSDSEKPLATSSLALGTNGAADDKDAGNETKGEQEVEVTKAMVEEMQLLNEHGFFEHAGLGKLSELMDVFGRGFSAAQSTLTI